MGHPNSTNRQTNAAITDSTIKCRGGKVSSLPMGASEREPSRSLSRPGEFNLEATGT